MCRLNEQQLQDGLIRGGGEEGQSPVAGYETLGYAHKITQASLITPLPWDRTRVLAEPFLSPQHCTGWIRQD